MAAPRRVIEVAFTEEELADLERVSRSRTEPASHVQRACILLTYRRTPSLYATGREVGVTHQTVERCLRRAQTFGVKAALKDSPRPGREPTITNEAKMFVARSGLPQSQGFGLSARSVDDAAAGRTRARTRSGGRICLSGPSRPGNLVQDIGRAGGQAAQDARLSRTPRSRFRREDGRSPERLSRGRAVETGGGATRRGASGGRDHLL